MIAARPITSNADWTPICKRINRCNFQLHMVKAADITSILMISGKTGMSYTIIGRALEGTGFSPDLAPLVIVMAISFGFILARYTPLLGLLAMPLNSLLLFAGAWAAHQLIELAAPDYATGAKNVLVTSFSGMTCTALLILICLRPDSDDR